MTIEQSINKYDYSLHHVSVSYTLQVYSLFVNPKRNYYFFKLKLAQGNVMLSQLTIISRLMRSSAAAMAMTSDSSAVLSYTKMRKT